MFKENPFDNIPIDFDINNPPSKPKQYDEKFLKRTDKAAQKIKETNNRRGVEYEKWLKSARFYLANKSLQFGRVPTDVLEQYSKLAEGYDKGISLLSAYNKLRRFKKSRRGKKCLHQN